MAAWKVADSLDQLLAQLDAYAPRRSKASDGSIGDAAHGTRDSDHNPWWSFAGQAYVTARDFTHDPVGGLDCTRLAEALRCGRDQRVKYVIWNRRIMAGAAGPQPWTWRPYSGPNPHDHHLHLSVVPDARALARIPWQLPGLTSTPGRDEFDMASLDDLRQIIREEVARAVWSAMIPDYYAPADAKTGQAPALPAFAALGWAAANAGHANDAARDAADGVDALKTAAGPSADVRYRLIPE